MIFKRYWESDRERFFKENGTDLPSLTDMGKIPRGTLWRANCKPMFIDIFFEHEHWRCHFDIGFLTDLASAPPIVRSLIDNDMEELIWGALVHDGLFQTKILGVDESGFSMANNVLVAMFKWYGGTHKEVIAVWAAMKTRTAWNTYVDRAPRDNIQRFHLQVIEE
jgi:hypothetical protein